MLSLKDLDASTKEQYLDEFPVADDRFSKLKAAGGWTVPELWGAARAGDLRRITTLLNEQIEKENGSRAAVDRRCSSTGRTLLHDATNFGHRSVVDLLCKKYKADVSCRTLMGDDTPLHLAASNDLRSICFVLLTSHGADPNATNKRKCTPLHYAALNGSVSTVKTLIQYGAKAGLVNDEGKLPSTIAFERGASEDMIAYFLKKMEEENREKYEAEMEGRRIEAAEMGLARDKLASELEAEAKRQFRHDAARSYKAWRQPKGPPEPEDPKPKGAFALRAERQALEAHLKQQAEVEAAANAKAAARAIGD